MNQITPVTSLNLSSPSLLSPLSPTAGNVAPLQTLGAATSQLASLGGLQPAGATNNLGVSINPTSFMGSPLTSPPASTLGTAATTSNPDLNSLLASVGTVTTAPLTAAPASTTPTPIAAAAPLASVNALATTNPQTPAIAGGVQPITPGLNNPELNNLLAGATTGVSAINQEVDALLTRDYQAEVAAGKYKGTLADYLEGKKGVDATKPIDINKLMKNKMALQGTGSQNSMLSQSLGSASTATVDSVVRRYQENGGNYAKAAEKVTPGALASLGLTAEQFKAQVMATVAKNPPAADTATATDTAEKTEKKETTTATKPKTTASPKKVADSTATTVKLKGTNTDVKVM